MKKQAISMLAAFLLAGGAVLPANVAEAATVQVKETQQWEASSEVPIDKKWTISFTGPLKRNVDFSQYVTVKDADDVAQELVYSLSQDRKKLEIKPVENYKANTEYVLSIQSGLPSERGNVLKKSIEKKFKTITVNPVSFKQYVASYVIENTGAGNVSATFDTADYIIVDGLNRLKDSGFGAKSMTLKEGQRAIVSFSAAPKTPVITNGSGKVAESKEEEAYKVVQLEQNGTIVVNNENTASLNYYMRYDGQSKTETGVAIATYNKATGSALNMYTGRISNIRMLEKTSEDVITNTKSTAIRVYIPAYSTDTRISEKQALASYTLGAGDKVKIASSVKNTALVTMPYEVSNQWMTGDFNTAKYDEYGSSVAMDEGTLDGLNGPKSNFVREGGENVVDNLSEQPMTIMAPERVAMFEKTTEDALSYYYLLKDEAIKVTIKDDLANFLGTEFWVKGKAGQVLESSELDSLGVWVADYHEFGTTKKHFNLEGKVGEVYLKNSSEESLEVVAPGRHTKYEKLDEREVINKYYLEPGQQIKLKSTEQYAPNVTSSSMIVAEDKTRRGSIKVEQTVNGNTATEQHTFSSNITWKFPLKRAAPYATFTNTGDTRVLVYGTKYIVEE